MASITVNYTVDGVEWPSILPILDGLSIQYDEDEGLASAPNGDTFILSLYPRAGYLRCDSADDEDDFCEAIFVLILNLPAPKGVRVIIQEDDFDEGISMELSDFIESITAEG
jgi:hypothetical protein